MHKYGSSTVGEDGFQGTKPEWQLTGLDFDFMSLAAYSSFMKTRLS
jgi:hypothetical protein